MLLKIEILADLYPTAMVNPAFVQHVQYTTRGNSNVHHLMEKSYTTITMADGRLYLVEEPIERVWEILQGVENG